MFNRGLVLDACLLGIALQCLQCIYMYVMLRRGVNLFRSLGGRGSGLINFNFHQKKFPIFPPKFRFSRQKFPTTFFQSSTKKICHLSQKLPFMPTPTFVPNCSSYFLKIITFQHTFSPKYDIVFSQTRPRGFATPISPNSRIDAPDVTNELKQTYIEVFR